MPRRIAVTGAFDELCSRDIRFLEEAARWGELTVWLWPDAVVRRELGGTPKFPEAERRYFLKALRFVTEAKLIPQGNDQADFLAVRALRPDIVAVREGPAEFPAPQVFQSVGQSESDSQGCQPAGGPKTTPDSQWPLRSLSGAGFRVIPERQLDGWPYSPPPDADCVGAARKKVLVTGCYDWFHSGHIRFFEEVSAFGDLYVVVGHDANIRLLKGEGHPMFSQEERRYLVGAVRFVKEALISTGDGWLDAEPEIERLKPDIYAVNEDGDRGGKREFCQARGIEYLVLKRAPAPGLPKRTSTNLRGF